MKKKTPALTSCAQTSNEAQKATSAIEHLGIFFNFLLEIDKRLNPGLYMLTSNNGASLTTQGEQP